MKYQDHLIRSAERPPYFRVDTQLPRHHIRWVEFGLGWRGISGATIAEINATAQPKKETFGELVAEKLGDTGLTRRYTSAIEAELRAQGYRVQEVDLRQEGIPKPAVEDGVLQLTGPRYDGADAIMFFSVTTRYWAPGAIGTLYSSSEEYS